MENNGQIVSVRIYNQSYNIRASGEESRARMLRVAAIVDARMREIERQGGTVDTLRLAILAALHLADDLEKANASHEASLALTTARAGDLSRMLDGILDGGGKV